jgi:hypothetical protein
VDAAFGNAICRPKRMEGIAVISSQSSTFRTQPQIAVPVLHHPAEPVGNYTWRVAFIEDDESHPIEACEAVKCGNPKITIRSLSHAADDILRKTIFHGPGLKVIFHGRRYKGATERTQADHETEQPATGESVGVPAKGSI